MTRTRIIATIGPASDTPEILGALIAAGMDVARLNASHSGIDELETRRVAIRDAAERAGRHVAIMLDLAGPKVRIGEMSAGTVLASGSVFTIVPGECIGDESHACVNHDGFAEAVSTGDRLLIADGAIELRVEEVAEGAIRTRVVIGGPLSSRKGISAPGVPLGLDAITEWDRDALAWGLRSKVDFIAQSFVRSPADVTFLRELMGAEGLPIVAKIERKEAASQIDEIVAVSDAVMVARGDLGVETSPEEVPVLQKQVIAACRRRGVPVIVATQMLESMTASPRPTRAEASDVANAIFDEVDAVMLSAETAVGNYPVSSVATMGRIASVAEKFLPIEVAPVRSAGDEGDVTAAVSAAACDLAADLAVAAIVTATQSGATARSVSWHRPRTPIVAVTPFPHVARQLQMVWGIQSLVVDLALDTDLMLESVLCAVRDAGLATPGARVAITAGIASRVPGATDFVLVREVPL